ncbi:hypothetical protein Y032_0022g531 [Ancylostoma ceylanicum]|uniref:Uncharacterized protein n=1 Tax=Ancylostoma ceylanicum TaxID=53326 RepID=A0A016UXV8_9BILA|nr:hypothetical protein Y032_0022g531 [Ancylostoma ceylanicum]
MDSAIHSIALQRHLLLIFPPTQRPQLHFPSGSQLEAPFSAESQSFNLFLMGQLSCFCNLDSIKNTKVIFANEIHGNMDQKHHLQSVRETIFIDCAFNSQMIMSNIANAIRNPTIWNNNHRSRT